MEIKIWAVASLVLAFLAFVLAAVAAQERKPSLERTAYKIGCVLSFFVCCNIVYCKFDFGMEREGFAGIIGLISLAVTVGVALVVFFLAKGISSYFKAR